VIEFAGAKPEKRRVDLKAALQRPTQCKVFEFRVLSQKGVRAVLASKAVGFKLGGHVRRITKDCVVCKVVSSLKNDEYFAEFLEWLLIYDKIESDMEEPVLSDDASNLNALRAKFQVFSLSAAVKQTMDQSEWSADPDPQQQDGITVKSQSSSIADRSL